MQRKKDKATDKDGEDSLSLSESPQLVIQQKTFIESNLLNISLSLAFVGIGSFFYFKSLEGGDDEWVMRHIPDIGRNVLIAVVCYMFAFVRAFKVARFPLKVATLVTDAVCLYLTLRTDQGAGFEHHGEFNIVVFVIFFIVFSIIFGSVYIIWKFRIWKSFIGSGIFTVIIVNVMLLKAKGNFGQGILNHRLVYDVEGCSLPQVTPFIDILPRRYLNFFTGSETCQKWGSKPFSSLKDGVLTIDCPNAKAHYIVNANFAERESFIEYHQGERVDTANLKRPWSIIEPKDLRRDYNGPVHITEGEYIRAFCGEKEDYHVQNVLKPEVLVSKKMLQEIQGREDDPNIVMLVLDSVSRQHFLRRLPITTRTLENLDSSNGGTYEVSQFFRYFALDCCTPGNMRAIITGIHREEHDKVDLSQFFAWQTYSDAGYVTLWQNDLCQDYFHMYFHTNDSYTDHEAILPFCHYEYSRASNTFSNFKGGPYSIEKRCIGDRYVHSYAFDYLDTFFENYKDLPKFAVAKFAEAHEASGAVITTMDKELSEFITRTLTNHPNTIFVVVADHGLALGPYPLSRPGKVENALPVLFLTIPKSWTDKHPEALEGLEYNSQSLTTHWDLHKTLLHILDYPHITSPKFPESTIYSKSSKSLFEHINYSRTCPQAGVSKNRCICTNPYEE